MLQIPTQERVRNEAAVVPTFANPAPRRNTMAEPLGAISASLYLAEKIGKYFKEVHDAPKHAANLKEELRAVS